MKKLLLMGLFLAGVLWAIFSFSGLATQGTYSSIVLDFRDDLSEEQIATEVNAIAQTYATDPRLNSVFSPGDHLYVVEGDRQLLNQLRQSDLRQYTESIDPNYLYSITTAPNDPDYSKQWNLRSINVESAWDETRGSGVTVAVIDTGITQGPDLANTQMVPGYDFVNDRTDASDDNGHGTHVAGTIAQSTNNNYGVAGIAYEANLMPLKVLSAGGSGSVADIAEAIRFAADQGADVINMSLGGGGDSAVMQEAIDYAHSKGVVMIAAAGNANQNSASFPARYPNVIAVSALGPTGIKAPYSNYGAGVDISAPGGAIDANGEGGILQETVDPSTGSGIFAQFQGTSMASPHVAGVAALIKAAGIEDPDQVRQVLIDSVRVIQEDPQNHYGAGQLDAGAAVKLALRGNITLRDFFRWLRENGYLNLKFWFDGGAVALLPKVLMIIGSYLLAWFLRNYLPSLFAGALTGGLWLGSVGIFFLQGLYIFDLPQAPLRVLGSSLPELISAFQGTTLLNPISASVAIPVLLLALCLGFPNGRQFTIGASLGMASCLAISAFLDAEMMWLGSGMLARGFLIVNAILCFGVAYLAAKSEG